MRFTATKAKTEGNHFAHAVIKSYSPPDSQEQFDLIAARAYYKAEERGFIPGHELDDWLKAETEINLHGEQS